ncbi:hypothetical protein SORBI_3010G107300 [Sorghum bicolor]|uniref:Uncharacterized protein n=1 Tax=Sorghum bicolor TaxID=4558 RepID=A0A194YIF1_SORBI|nr:hypothetical protein SORBI_3010G107300 [Sorghum bicolor]
MVEREWMSKHCIPEKASILSTYAAMKSTINTMDNNGESAPIPLQRAQQLLEYKFGPKKASTLNIYDVMKSGFKEVDNSQPYVDGP